MGTFSNVTLAQLPIAVMVIAVSLVVALLQVKSLNVMLLGDAHAASLGIDVRRTRRLLLAVTGLLTATVTAFCGPVSFIGLASPHIARMLIGSDNHGRLLPFTILTGADVALLCCWICSLPLFDGAIPLSSVTPIVGAPVVIYVILKKKTCF